MNNNLIGRQPLSHVVLNDGLVVNDYSLSRVDSSLSLHSLNGGTNRSRSISPGNIRNAAGSARARTRSPSASRRSARTSQSVDFERRRPSPSPQRRSNLRSSTTRLYDQNDYHQQDNGKRSSSFTSISIHHLEFHSTKDCAICRLHHLHSEQSQRAKSFEQVVN